MKKKSTIKKTGETSCFSVSDWVTFLSNEKHGMMNNVVNFSVLLVGVIALVLATSGYTVFAIASVIIALGCVGWAYFKVLGPLHQRGNLADGILKRLISGELKDADSIRDEWVLGLSVIRRGWLRQGKARLAALKRAWHYQAKPRLLALKETSRRKWETGLAALERAWRYKAKPRLSAFAETCRRRGQAGQAALRKTWSQEKPRLVGLKETWRHRWEAGLATLRGTWSHEKARLAALGQTWRLW